MVSNIGGYLCSLPERVVRSVTALAAGTLREVGEAALPRRLLRTRLYHVMVDSTLRYLIEEIGQVQGTYVGTNEEMKNFIVRRTAGNVLEVAGIVAFRASPVWVFAALADLSGAGRDLIADIAEELKKEGLLDPDRRFETIDQLLDGFEGMSGHLAINVNAPPLDVATLRAEWTKLQEQARKLTSTQLPSPSLLWDQWRDAKQTAADAERSVFEISSAMALAAVRRLPDNARWISRAAQVSTRRTGQMLAQGLLDDYGKTIKDMRAEGFLAYWTREFKPYLAGALQQFSPKRASLTERLMKRR
jgi:hypothetical protein